METNDQIFARQLIRHVVANARNLTDGKEEREREIRGSFHRCMLERIKRLKAQRKKEMQDEGLMSFVHALGGGIAHAAAEPIASALGVSTKSIVKLGRAAFSKPKSTTQMKKSKRITAKLKTSKTPSATASPSHAPVSGMLTKASLMSCKSTPSSPSKPKTSSVLSRTQSSLMSSTASHTTPNAPTYTVAAINQFKAANRQKIRKMQEEKPTEEGDNE